MSFSDSDGRRYWLQRCSWCDCDLRIYPNELIPEGWRYYQRGHYNVPNAVGPVPMYVYMCPDCVRTEIPE
jgi:hypothetical protein